VASGQGDGKGAHRSPDYLISGCGRNGAA